MLGELVCSPCILFLRVRIGSMTSISRVNYKSVSTVLYTEAYEWLEGEKMKGQ